MPVAVKRKVSQLSADSAGMRLSPAQFDRADFEDGWRYELIDGRLIVSPIPSEKESDPNGELEYLLRVYRDTHPKGKILDATMPERNVVTGNNRRRADRVIWSGLGRKPKKNETPTIVVEFVSVGKRNRRRDYEEKRDEYLEAGVQEYWIIDRFERQMTVWKKTPKRVRRRVIKEKQQYETSLLPGFVLPLAQLLAVADAWE